MTVTVYHWPSALNMKNVSVGHVALLVTTPKARRYLSWYPRDSKSSAGMVAAATLLIAAAPINHHAKLDVIVKGEASDIVVIEGLDEEAIIAYIDAKRSYYSLFGTSCAQTVADALRSGIGAKRFTAHLIRGEFGKAYNTIVGAGQNPGTENLNPIWTPQTVADFARSIKQNLEKNDH